MKNLDPRTPEGRKAFEAELDQLIDPPPKEPTDPAVPGQNAWNAYAKAADSVKRGQESGPWETRSYGSAEPLGEQSPAASVHWLPRVAINAELVTDSQQPHGPTAA